MGIIMVDFKNRKHTDSFRRARRQDDGKEDGGKLENKAALTGFVTGVAITVAVSIALAELPKIEHNFHVIKRDDVVESVLNGNRFSSANNQQYLLDMLSAYRAKAKASENWAGYEVDGTPGTFSGVSTAFTVPKITWSGSKAIDMWVGLGGKPSEGLIQAGVSASGSYIKPWIEELPKAANFINNMQIRQGDKISISIRNMEKDGKGSFWAVSFVDKTTGKSIYEKVNYKASIHSAECMVESPRTDLSQNNPILQNMPDFGTIKFSACTPSLTAQGIDEVNHALNSNSKSIGVLFMSILRDDGRFATKITDVRNDGRFSVNYVNDGPFLFTGYRVSETSSKLR